MTEAFDEKTLSVGFNTDTLAERYRVFVKCQGSHQLRDAYTVKSPMFKK